MTACGICGKTPGEAGKIYRSKSYSNLRLCPECRNQESFIAPMVEQCMHREIILKAIVAGVQNV